MNDVQGRWLGRYARTDKHTASFTTTILTRIILLKIYPYRNLDGAWALVPDTVNNRTKDDPEEDFLGRNFNSVSAGAGSGNSRA